MLKTNKNNSESDIVLNKAISAVKNHEMIKSGDNVVVALSGGADSVTLLHCLNTIKDEFGFKLYACHVNHNLRGADSDNDRDFVQNLCKKMNIPLKIFSVDVMGAMEKHTSVEETARKLRYRVFSEESARLGAKVATAHNSCDNTETVFLNLLRGTGLKGLCGIPSVRDYLIRPLILCTRNEIEAYCKANSLQFVTDKTNFSTEYKRNKIRLELLPKLIEINPSLYDGMNRMTSALSEDSVFLEDMAKKALDDARLDDKIYDSEKLSSLPKPILTRAVSAILKESNIEPTAIKINGFLEIIKAGAGKVNVEKNKFAVVKKRKAEIQIIIQKYRKKN